MVRMAPYGKQPTQRRVPVHQMDAEKIVASRQPHGVARNEENAPHQRGHLRGPGARISGTAAQFQASERHHYDPDAPSVRFSQGVVTSASGACIAHQARKRHAASCRVLGNADSNVNGIVMMKPVPAAVNGTKPATGCVIPMGEGAPPKTGKAVHCDNFAGSTMQGTSIGPMAGNDAGRYQRSASLAAGRKACDAASKPKRRGTVSDEFMQSHPNAAPVRTNEQRYADTARPQKRVFTAPVASAVVAPWDK